MLGKSKEKPKRILVIDDDPLMTDLLADFCSGLGYEVKCLNDGLQALATAITWKPDLITLDLEMPGKDGLEVLRELKGESSTRTIPVFIISVVARDVPLPIDELSGVFNKPVKLNPLLNHIKEVLQVV